MPEYGWRARASVTSALLRRANVVPVISVDLLPFLVGVTRNRYFFATLASSVFRQQST